MSTTTYLLPNFLGELFEQGRRPNATLQLIGGVGGARNVQSWQFPVGQQYQVPFHALDTSRLEGADAPAHVGTVRAPITNVTQIWQESVIVSYSKQAASQMLAGLGVGGMSDPVTDELDFQTGVKLEFMARNLNWTILNQTFNQPVDNTTARRTRGLLPAITTTVIANGGVPRALALGLFDDAFALLIANGGVADGDNVIALANTAQMRRLNELFRADKLAVDDERFIGGVRVRTVYTTFGVLNFVLDQDMPQDEIALVNFDALQLVATEVPGKGVLFREELAKTGANERYQIYGELGLDHGPEWLHARITDLTV